MTKSTVAKCGTDGWQGLASNGSANPIRMEETTVSSCGGLICRYGVGSRINVDRIRVESGIAPSGNDNPGMCQYPGVKHVSEMRRLVSWKSRRHVFRHDRVRKQDQTNCKSCLRRVMPVYVSGIHGATAILSRIANHTAGILRLPFRRIDNRRRERCHGNFTGRSGKSCSTLTRKF